MEWSGGGKWDNCNSIINKYIKKKKKKKKKFCCQEFESFLQIQQLEGTSSWLEKEIPWVTYLGSKSF